MPSTPTAASFFKLKKAFRGQSAQTRCTASVMQQSREFELAVLARCFTLAMQPERHAVSPTLCSEYVSLLAFVLVEFSSLLDSANASVASRYGIAALLKADTIGWNVFVRYFDSQYQTGLSRHILTNNFGHLGFKHG